MNHKRYNKLYNKVWTHHQIWHLRHLLMLVGEYDIKDIDKLTNDIKWYDDGFIYDVIDFLNHNIELVYNSEYDNYESRSRPGNESLQDRVERYEDEFFEMWRKKDLSDIDEFKKDAEVFDKKVATMVYNELDEFDQMKKDVFVHFMKCYIHQFALHNIHCGAEKEVKEMHDFLNTYIHSPHDLSNKVYSFKSWWD